MGATHTRPVSVSVSVSRERNDDSKATRMGMGMGSSSANEETSTSVSANGCACLGSAEARRHASQLRSLRALQRRFKRSDTNKSGGISYKEMCRALHIEDDLMSQRLFSLLDADGNKEISFPELSAALATFGKGELDRARFAFCLYDLDGNGEGEKRAEERKKGLGEGLGEVDGNKNNVTFHRT